MSAPEIVASLSRRLPGLRGRSTLAHHWHGRSRGATGRWTVRMRDGYTLVGARASLQTWNAAFQGTYGEHAADVLRPWIVPGTSVLDIGACMGFVTIPLARTARERGADVVAYEPVPENVLLLEENVSKNGLEDIVKVRSIGLGRDRAELTMAVEGTGAGNASVMEGVDFADMRQHRMAGSLATEITVRVARLDEEELGRCSAIKIDVEGFELEVLAGGAGLIQDHRPAIFAEFNPQWLRSRGVPIDAPRDWVSQQDYVAYGYPFARNRVWQERRPLAAVPIGIDWPSGDVLLVPRERLVLRAG